MKERPILFSAPMVRAILDGSKTQTRRALRDQPPADAVQVSTFHHPEPRAMFYAWGASAAGMTEINEWPPRPCPYGVPGHRLWVKETFTCTDFHYPDAPVDERDDTIFYRADPLPCWEGEEHEIRWRPSIFMPRWASRITLEVTDVRVERLYDISEADAVAEGLRSTSDDCAWHVEDDRHRAVDPRDSYASLWESINGAGAWDANPWVWVVSFKVLL